LNISKPTKVRCRKTGLTYKLIPKPEINVHAYYLTANDGFVPSGQMIYRTADELDEMFLEVK
jgi:hypothetical protein